jgi:uncharacterized membrane protein
MIGLEVVYTLAGIMMVVVAGLNLVDATNPRRYRNALFWAAYAASLLLGSYLPDFANGCLVVVLVLVGGLGGLGRGAPRTTSHEERAQAARRWKNRLFVPALLVPALTLGAALALPGVRVGGAPLLDPKNLSVIALGLAALVALAVALVLLRQPLGAAGRECRRLMDMVGWAAILPQILAALGVVFATIGVGDRIAEVLGRVVPLDNAFVAVATFTVGMALFTMIMGNAFAAFPVMTAAIGLPVIVVRLGGDPAVMGALGMLSGFCGTLMTPMAANFNIVPAALLELPDQHGVIRAQVPTGLALLGANTLLMYLFVFHAR